LWNAVGVIVIAEQLETVGICQTHHRRFKIMQVTIKHQPSYALAVVAMESNETIKVEPGAMVSHSSGLTTETKADGGLFGGLKRMVAGESFFQNTWTAPAVS